MIQASPGHIGARPVETKKPTEPAIMCGQVTASTATSAETTSHGLNA